MKHIIKLMLWDKAFWLSSLAIWGIIWSIFEGLLFAVQLFDIKPKPSLGLVLLIIFLISVVSSGYKNWPLRTKTIKIKSTGVSLRLAFGNIWDLPGEKIVGVTRCFSSKVDDVVIHSNSLHGMFIKRNFKNNLEAKKRIDLELERTTRDKQIFEPGKTIKITGSNDTVFLVGLTLLDPNNKASVTPNDYFIALSNMWEFIRSRNGGEEIVCPLLGARKGRLNFSSSSIFSELLNSALTEMKNGFITKDLSFVLYPGDIKKGLVNLYEIKDIFEIICSAANIDRITYDVVAKEV